MSTCWIECPIYVPILLALKKNRYCQSSHFFHDICDKFLNQKLSG
jgi:hypothetical protein